MGQRDLGARAADAHGHELARAGHVPDGGSPQLFQTGETFEGRLLVDRQHPHDFFMNLSATYRHALGARGAPGGCRPRWCGEPALGPTAFMHRASAGENPTAPLAITGRTRRTSRTTC